MGTRRSVSYSPRERPVRAAADEALEELRSRFDDDASIDSGIDRLHSEIMWQSGTRELAQQHQIPWQPEIGDHAAWGHDRDLAIAGWAKC